MRARVRTELAATQKKKPGTSAGKHGKNGHEDSRRHARLKQNVADRMETLFFLLDLIPNLVTNDVGGEL